tara:strand:+ start:5780 stop:6118 length:339 start_codon:yes stop_codon:yes gene_type:complete
MPARFVEVTDTLEELNLRRGAAAWAESTVSTMTTMGVGTNWTWWRWEKVEQAQEMVLVWATEAQAVAERAPKPPGVSRWLLLCGVVLFLVQGLAVGCHRRWLLKQYAHAKRL